MNLTDIYNKLIQTDMAEYQIRKMLEAGKPERAKIIVMTFATNWDMYLHSEEAMEVLGMFEDAYAVRSAS